MADRSQQFRLTFPLTRFPMGCGLMDARPGGYQLASNFDGRYGIPGPREVADLTGIAANFRVYQILKHADTNVAITSDGTDTKVYRVETTWVLKATISTRVPTGPQCAVSFKGILAIGFTGGNPYQYTPDVGAGAWTFTASTKTAGNAEQATCFLKQTTGVPAPKVVYALSPNEIYYTFDLTNTDGVGTNPTYIDDTSSTQNYVTSIAEEPGTGRILVGMRHALYTILQEPPNEGVVIKLTEDFPDGILDATGQSDRKNFEGPVLLGGAVYYPVQGYDILVWRAGTGYDLQGAPRHISGVKLPRMDLPINALVRAGPFLVAFLGTKTPNSVKSLTNHPLTTATLAGTLSSTSDMYVGVPTSEGIVWHGILLECTNPLRYAYFDEDDGYLTMASGDAELINVQTTRCLFTIDNPSFRSIGSAVILNTGTWKLEFGAIDMGDAWTSKRWDSVQINAIGVSNGSLEVEYVVLPDYLASAFETDFATFTTSASAFQGAAFPDETVGTRMHLRLVGTGGSDVYVVPLSMHLRTAPAPDRDELPARR